MVSLPNLSQIDEIIKKLTQPVQENASALGDEDAKITLIEFADYECQECAKFHNETTDQIINDYVNTGKIKFLFKDFTISDIANNNNVNTSGKSIILWSRSREILAIP